MNRNLRNRGEEQGFQNQRAMRHTRNNALYENLFDTVVHCRAPLEASHDPMLALATPGQGELIDTPLPAEIVRRRLSDYARPVVNAPLQPGANYKIDSHILGLLPNFHGIPSEDPYRHVDEFS